VIVDRHRGIRRIDGELAKDDGIPWRLDDFYRRPTGLQDRGGLPRAPSDILGMCRVHTDGRDFDEIV